MSLWGDFNWGEGIWGAESPEVSEYAIAHIQLLPRGFAWNRDPDGLESKLYRGISKESVRVEERVRALVNEADPLQTFELLGDWERVYGLPEPCGTPPIAVADRQQALYAKMRRRGATNIPRLLGLLEDLGYPDAEILTLADPFTCVSECTDALYGFEGYWSDTIYVVPNATTENDEQLQCMLHGQAQEVVLFSEFSLNNARVFYLEASTFKNKIDKSTGVANGTTYVSDGDFLDIERDNDGEITWAPVGYAAGSPSSGAAWVRLETLGIQQAMIVSEENTGLGVLFQILGTNQVEFLHNGTTQKRRRSSTVLEAGRWYHLAYVDTGGDAASSTTLLIDGVPESVYSFSQDGVSLVPADDAFRIGDSGGLAVGNFDGQMRSGASMWLRALSTAEIKAHMTERPEGWP